MIVTTQALCGGRSEKLKFFGLVSSFVHRRHGILISSPWMPERLTKSQRLLSRPRNQTSRLSSSLESSMNSRKAWCLAKISFVLPVSVSPLTSPSNTRVPKLPSWLVRSCANGEMKSRRSAIPQMARSRQHPLQAQLHRLPPKTNRKQPLRRPQASHQTSAVGRRTKSTSVEQNLLRVTIASA